MKISNPGWAYRDKWYRKREDNLCTSCDRFYPESQGQDRCTAAGLCPIPRERSDSPSFITSYPGKRLAIIDCLGPDFRFDMHREIASGLSQPQKSIPSKYLYDAQGSKLFDEICTLPEYYPTRIELKILQTYAGSVMDFFDGKEGDLIEIGSGSDLKIRRLLNAIPRYKLRKIRYIPMDISQTGLVHSSLRILRDFEGLHICGVIGDFTCHLERLPRGRKLITFFGGTFGNFPDAKGIELLKKIAGIMGPEDRLLIGIDMLKEIEIIEAAYNDSRGVTARFNLNILNHINQGLRSDFRHEDFEHWAFFNPDREQIEMHLKAMRDVRTYLHSIHLPVHVAKGETLHTEISRKFSREKAEKLFQRAGFSLADWYTDPREWFSLVSLRTNHCR
jgi:L-histidine Nalpha-methyltransferase